MIQYSERVDDTELLGPGTRAVLWVYGCCFDCPGCVAQNYRKGAYKTADVDELVKWYAHTGAEGLTISGGEPMLQAEGLAQMIKGIREIKDCGVIIYSGFHYEQLLEMSKENSGIRDLLEETDILIDGPYLKKEDHNEPYRGSANQRILRLSQRYEEELINSYYYETKGRKIDIRLSNQKTVMIGVPSKEQVEIWGKIKALGDKK